MNVDSIAVDATVRGADDQRNALRSPRQQCGNAGQPLFRHADGRWRHHGRRSSGSGRSGSPSPATTATTAAATTATTFGGSGQSERCRLHVLPERVGGGLPVPGAAVRLRSRSALPGQNQLGSSVAALLPSHRFFIALRICIDRQLGHLFFT